MSESWRFRLAKTGRMRFLSHLDLVRTLSRSFRRAGLRLEHTAGFHPHPMLSFGPALAVGMESTAEYFDAVLADPPPEPGPAAALNVTLPPGISILQAAKMPPDRPSLAASINAAAYLLRVQGPPAALAALADLLRRDRLPVLRQTGGKAREIDLRPLLLALAVKSGGEVNVLGVVGNSGNLRPGELIGLVDGLSVLGITRIGLFLRSGGALLEPISGMETDWQESARLPE